MSKPQKIYLQDYSPSAYLINQTKLKFELTEDFTIVNANIDFYKNSNIDKVFLDGKNLELINISVDNQTADYELTENGLWLFNLPNEFTLQTTVKIYPQNNTSLNGLYKSSGNFCTQCEAEGFRNITYYLDRPDVLAKFEVEIFANYPVLLSNGNLASKTNNYAKWIDPFPKPCYLFALVVGDLAVNNDTFITKSNKKIKLAIFSEKHNIDKTDFAMLSLKNAMTWDENRFGLEYDLDNYNIVAVDDFNMGAMENKGLNIFNSSCVLASPETATDDNYLTIEAVIGHEYFHNWTGNRITCRDWFQLSLKEGLTVFRDQEFSGDLRLRSIKRIEDINYLRTFQFAEDSSPFSHPVRPESYIEMNNFYTLTIYEKGSEIVRMLQTMVGIDGFRKGMDLYFARYDGRAVTIEDFVSSIVDANNFEIKNFMLWYQKSGTPTIEIVNNNNVLTITQDDNRLTPIKYGILDNYGKEIKSGVLLLDSIKQEFDFSSLPKNIHFSYLRDFSAPVNLINNLNDKQRIFLISFDTNAFVRFDNIQFLYQQAILNNNKSIFIALDYIIKNENNNEILSLLLDIPSEKLLHSKVKIIDVLSVHNARKIFITKLANKYKNYFINSYNNLKTADYKFDNTNIINRKFKNICLNFLASTGDYSKVYEQFINANCMTDELVSFKLLLSSEYKKEAIDSFYEKYKNDELVVNKWFLTIAQNHTSSVIDIISLLGHRKFDITNPNKVRSVIGGFSSNFINFHTDEGYKLLTKFIIRLDKINPQIAARIVTNLINFSKFDKKYKDKQIESLLKIKTNKYISNDVFEIVNKAL